MWADAVLFIHLIATQSSTNFEKSWEQTWQEHVVNIATYHVFSTVTPRKLGKTYYTISTARGGGGSFQDKEPIGRGRVEFTWFESQLMPDSSELRVKWFGCRNLRFKWFGCQLIWNSNDFGWQSIRDSSDWDVKWFEIQVIWLINDLGFKWVGDFLFCETSFKNEALKLTNKEFLWDFLPKWTFEYQKRSISARLPSKMKLASSKTQFFCKTSFKNQSLKLKNAAFLRDFLQKSKFEAQKRSFSARLPSKTKLWSSKTQLFETSFKNDTLTRPLASEFQYVLAILKWIVQKYCACHGKVEPRHTNSCNCHAKWSLLVTLPWHEICNPSTDSASEASNIDIAKHENPAPARRNASFHTLFKSTTPANIFATLTNSCACHVFCNAPKSPRLPREKHFNLQKRPETFSF